MAGMEERYDTALLGILQNEGQIAKFLNVVFGFLYRRTDFYLQMKEKTDKLGFPPGIALKLTVGAFKKYEEMASRDEERRQAKRKQQEEDLQKKLKEIHAQEQEKKAEASEPMDTNSVPQPPVGQEVPAPQAEVPPKPANQKKILDEQIEPASRPKDNKSETVSVPSANQSKSDEEVQPDKKTEGDKKEKGATKSEDDDDPELTKLQKRFQENPDSYNGAQRDNYSWSQSITDVDVHVKVPKYICKGKDVTVTIEKKRLKACHRGTDGSWVTVVDGALTWDIQKEESMWSLVPGEHIHINLEKVQERWWEAILEGEPQISVRKIDPSRPITDLDDEAQAKIEEMMYNEHQKKLGKPQSQEQKVHNMLKQAWDAEGSPFKGQPFDPSKLNISSGDASNMMAGMGQVPTTK